MKTILLMTAVLVFAGCGKKSTTSGADTTGMAPTADSSSMTHSDSTMTRDTAK
jgi:uncharacterized lipoprotein YajG